MKFILYILLFCYSFILYAQSTKIHEKKQAEIEIFLNKANVHLSKGEDREAFEYIEDALFINPLSVEAYLYRAEYYIKIERYSDAIKDLEYVIKYSKDSTYAYMRMGYSYSRMRALDNALNAYLKAMSGKPNSDVYYYMGLVYEAKKQQAKALDAYNYSIKLDRENAKSYYSRGLICINTGKYGQAISDFEKAISIGTYDNQYLLYVKTGDAYAKIQNFDIAIDYYELAIELKPKLSDAYYGRGVLYFDLKYYNDAIADLSYAISINPYFSEAYRVRGTAYLASGQADKGMKDFDYMKRVQKNGYIY